MSDEQEYLSLKWGTLKAWKLTNPIALDALKRYYAAGVSMSAMAQHDTPEQKALICQIIDAIGVNEIYLDWDGRFVSKDEAKRYVMEYGYDSGPL